MRFRLFRAAIPLVALGALFWPTMLTYTFLAGERATAQVAECHQGGSRSPLRCSGTWRTADGDSGSGGVYGLGSSAAGRTVAVRVGPMGPYRPGVRAVALPVSVSLFWLLSFGGLTVRVHRAGRRARRLLAEPALPEHLLTVTGKAAHTLDGRRSASVVPLPAPPTPPAPGVRATYWDVHDGAGRPVCRVEKRGTRKSLPELVVWEPSGGGHVIRPTSGHSPGHYTLSAFDGTPVGTVEPFAGTKWGAYAFKDLQGVVRARSVCRMPEWVLRLEPGAPPLFLRLALAFTTGQRRQIR
ncbi:hypothetical protein [Streptomyces sp. SH5]|uniref:hypothetical protein n=1 Tax=Streptomyces sp. SH5 TaxID=3041765 RepID=UPI002478022B|nr:hypothetical protein [Streptomyces sp. SH5]WGP14342.1 hypothetical protein QFA72_34035 [Streptomyces sp. SH5]